MLIQDKQALHNIQTFDKYARFICEKFNVNVILSGTDAHTDGKNIYVPNVEGMNERELDFIFAIVLHESLHIKYSDFSLDACKQIRSDIHFKIFNSIEDARIENLGLQDFDGAKDIFHRLYQDFLFDSKFMDKIFKMDTKDADVLHVLVSCIHHKILKINFEKDVRLLFRKGIVKSVNSFIKKHNIDGLISSSKIDTSQDAIDLSVKIYDMLFSKKKDKSGTNNIESVEKEIKDIKDNTIPKMNDLAKKMKNELDKLADDFNAKQKDLEKMQKARQNFRKQIIDELKKLRSENFELAKEIISRRKIEKKEKKVSSVNRKINQTEETVEDLKNAIESLKEFLNNNESEEDSKKINKIKDDISKKSKKLENAKNKLSSHQNKKSEYKKSIGGLNDKLNNKFSGEKLDGLTNKYGNNKKRKGEIINKMHDYDSIVNSKEGDVRNAYDEYIKERDDCGKEIAKGMKSIQNTLDKNEMDTQVMPTFENNPLWKDGDEIQKEFDKEASDESGDVCTNGEAFSKQDTRNIIARIDKTRDDINSIDLTKYFKEKNNFSMLDSLNEEISKITNTEMFEEIDVALSSDRKHIPFTTNFDVVKVENKSDGKKLNDIKQKKAVMISKVRNVFRTKFKFQKKDRFHFNKEEGGIDSRSLWKLATKTDDKFFEINNPKFVNKISASVTVDLSGSLDKQNTDFGNKLREFAFYISEGLNSCYIPHEVLGYVAPVNDEMRNSKKTPYTNRNSNSLETIVYKKFTDNKNNGIDNLNIQAADNSDGESLRIAAKRLLKERSKRKIMFVLTDGKPFLSDSSIDVLDQDLKDTLRWMASNKIEVYAFGFNKSGFNFYGDRFCLIEKDSDFIDFAWKKFA